MSIVNKFNVNKQQVTLDADIIENMSANDVSYNASTQYDENTVGDKLSKLNQQVIYDVTENNDGATFDSLSELLSSENLSTLIPSTVKCGGMSIRFVNSSDNKYVQYRYMGTETTGNPNPFINAANWQGVDDKPTAESENVLYVDMAGKRSVNLINSNTTWIDGYYINTISGDFVEYSGLSTTEKISVIGRTKMFFFSYTDILIDVGMSIAIYDSSNVVLYDSSSAPYFSSLQHIEGYIYSVDLPENAAYVRINVKTNEKSKAFVYFVYNSNSKISLPWLQLLDSQIPEILPNKIFSDNYIFSSENYIVQNYTEGGYIRNDGVGRTMAIVSSDSIQSAIIPCQEGDVLVVKNGQFILPSDTTYSKFYYAFGSVNEPTKSVVSNNDIQNYISVYNNLEKTFIVNVPSGCGYFYLTMADLYRADDNVKFCVIKKKLNWLRVEQDNMSKEVVTAIANVVVSSPTFSSSVANISESAEQTRDAEYHLWDSICKKIEFNGKVIKFFGDSITAGTCSPKLGNAGNDSWPNTFSKLVGATANVNAIGGSCITDSAEGDQYNIGTRVKQYVKSTDEIIIIAGGTNDFNTGKAVGAFGDKIGRASCRERV